MSKDEDVAYHGLRSAISSGELMPNERLIELSLAAEYGVGRERIREAFARLSQESLIERLPNRGARVRRISEREAIEILEARVALETIAVRTAAVNATDADLAVLAGILADMETRGDDILDRGYAADNARFHNEILRISGNATVIRLVGSLRAHNTSLHFPVAARPTEPLARLREHRRIYEAIAAHDPDRAEAAMREHVGDIVARRYQRLGERGNVPAR